MYYIQKEGISINDRSLKILEILDNEFNDYTINDLSKKLHVSSRTINSDISEINIYLKKIDYGEIITKNGNLELKNLDTLNKVIFNLTFDDYYMSLKERLYAEFIILAIGSSYIKSNNIANILSSSRSTIIKDLKTLDVFLDKHLIQLMSKSGRGITISGEELYIRELLYFISVNYNYIVYILINSIIKYENNLLIDKQLEKYFEAIKNVIGIVESRNQIMFYEKPYNIIISYLFFSIIRNNEGNRLLNYNNKYGHNSEKNIQISKDLIFVINNVACTNLSVYDQSFILDKLKDLDYKDNSKYDTDLLSIQFVTKKLIDNLSNDLSMPLNLDYELFINLSKHIERMKSNSITAMDDYLDLKKSLSNRIDLTDVIYKESKVLEEYFHRDISDIEINYISIYVYTSIIKLLNIVKKN